MAKRPPKASRPATLRRAKEGALPEVRATKLRVYTMPGHLIRRIQQVSVALFMEEAERSGIDLTPVQYAALTAIQTYPLIDQATLGGVIAYDRATIGSVIDRLEAKGLVKRTLSKENRRIRQLVLRTPGKVLLRRIQPVVERVQKRILSPLSRTDRDTFMRIMTQLASAHNEQSRAPLRPVSRAAR